MVNKILSKMKDRVDFVTGLARVNNLTSPERLYRSCGFIGNDIWYLV